MLLCTRMLRGHVTFIWLSHTSQISMHCIWHILRQLTVRCRWAGWNLWNEEQIFADLGAIYMYKYSCFRRVLIEICRGILSSILRELGELHLWCVWSRCVECVMCVCTCVCVICARVMCEYACVMCVHVCDVWVCMCARLTIMFRVKAHHLHCHHHTRREIVQRNKCLAPPLMSSVL